MDFAPELRPGVIAGEVTVSVRLWQRPRVRVGGRYPVGPATIEIEEMELVPFASIGPGDLARSGEADLETLRRRAAHAGPIGDDTLVYRVQFTLVGTASSPPSTDPARSRTVGEVEGRRGAQQHTSRR